jgi:flagellar basal-body rod protein FlgF
MELPSVMALARQMASQQEMDAIANNVANLNTDAYKAERVTFNSYLVRPSRGASTAAVIFPKLAALHREPQEGSIVTTDNPLDVAIRGNGYFVVDTPSGQRFTRDGHFSIDNQGRLVNAGGLPILNDTDKPIIVPQDAGKITIARDGTVSAGEQQLGQIHIVAFDDVQALRSVGSGLFAADNLTPNPVTSPDLVQGSLETSNIQPVFEMTRMMETARAYEQAQKVVDTEDDRMKRGIETLGKVA